MPCYEVPWPQTQGTAKLPQLHSYTEFPHLSPCSICYFSSPTGGLQTQKMLPILKKLGKFPFLFKTRSKTSSTHHFPTTGEKCKAFFLCKAMLSHHELSQFKYSTPRLSSFLAGVSIPLNNPPSCRNEEGARGCIPKPALVCSHC